MRKSILILVLVGVIFVIGVENAYAVDSDGDGVDDLVDNCINDPNTNQNNVDNDQFGDACDPLHLINSFTEAPCDYLLKTSQILQIEPGVVFVVLENCIFETEGDSFIENFGTYVNVGATRHSGIWTSHPNSFLFNVVGQFFTPTGIFVPSINIMQDAILVNDLGASFIAPPDFRISGTFYNLGGSSVSGPNEVEINGIIINAASTMNLGFTANTGSTVANLQGGQWEPFNKSITIRPNAIVVNQGSTFNLTPFLCQQFVNIENFGTFLNTDSAQINLFTFVSQFPEVACGTNIINHAEGLFVNEESSLISIFSSINFGGAESSFNNGPRGALFNLSGATIDIDGNMLNRAQAFAFNGDGSTIQNNNILNNIFGGVLQNECLGILLGNPILGGFTQLPCV